MGIYLYCLAGAQDPPPAGFGGVDDAIVTVRPVAGFTAWTSQLDAAPKPALDSVRAHYLVVEAAADHATPVPFRFGQWFETEALAERALEARRAELAAGLERVRGTWEYGVRVLDPAHVHAPPDRSSGRAYLESLARREHEDEADRRRGLEVAASLREWLGTCIREQRVRPLGSAGGLVAVAHLVDRHYTRSYDQRVREFPARLPALRFLLSGPWPPYGFVADD